MTALHGFEQTRQRRIDELDAVLHEYMGIFLYLYKATKLSRWRSTFAFMFLANLILTLTAK